MPSQPAAHGRLVYPDSRCEFALGYLGLRHPRSQSSRSTRRYGHAYGITGTRVRRKPVGLIASPATVYPRETMPAKPVFNDDQMEIIQATARRVWKAKFQSEGKTQEDMALAIGLSQQSVSNLLKGSYRPGVGPARQIALLAGKTLEELVGDFATELPPRSAASPREDKAPATSIGLGTFKNLDICIQFHSATKHWSPWTIAAARAGYFGNADFAPPEWVGKLDTLEKALERAKKSA